MIQESTVRGVIMIQESVQLEVSDSYFSCAIAFLDYVNSRGNSCTY